MGSCKHTFALVTQVNNEEDQSCTSKPQSWGVGCQADPGGTKEIIGGVVQKKEAKRKVKEIPLEPLIDELLIDVECPFMSIYLASKK